MRGLTDIYEKEVSVNAEWTLARDAQGAVYVAGTNGMLHRYSDSGI